MNAELTVACDGSCLRNPGGPTGWAWVAADGRWASSGQPTGTNQVAELWGVLSVLRDFPDTPLAIQVDSVYAMKVATVWGKTWARAGWRTKDGKPVANLPLVLSIMRRLQERDQPARFIKVPGHDPKGRYPLNAAADVRARAAATYARQHEEARAFSGADREVAAAFKARVEESRKMPVREVQFCKSCDGPISETGDCRCSM